jgi:hypothetical protein
LTQGVTGGLGLNAFWLFARFFFPGSFQVFEEKKPEDWREDGIDPQCNQDVTNKNKRPVSKSAGDAISKHLTFREDVNIRHQIVVGAHRASTVLAEPRSWFLWS